MTRNSVKSGGGKVVAALFKEKNSLEVASEIEEEDDAEMAVLKLYKSLDRKDTDSKSCAVIVRSTMRR